MTLYFELTSAQGASSRVALQPGLQRIKAAPGDRYRIYDDATGRTPPDIVVKRLDSHMIIEGLPGGARVELSDFYASCGVSSPCTLVVDNAGLLPGRPLEVSPSSPPLQALTDGSFVVHPAGYSGGRAIAVADSEGFPRAAAYAVGGLAIVALAGAGGGGGGGGDDGTAPPVAAPAPAPSPVPSPPPPVVPPTGIDDVAPGRPVVTSALAGGSRTPVIAGAAEPGAEVRLEVDSDRNGVADARYVTTADASGAWRVDLANQAPSSGRLPPGGLPSGSASIVTAIAVDGGGNTSDAVQFEISVRATAPGTLASVAAVTDDVTPRTGTVANGGATNDTTPTVSGGLSEALAPGESLQVLRNGAAVTAPVVVEGGGWRLNDGALADGVYTYSARVVSAAGAGPESPGYRIAVDTVNNLTATIDSATDNVNPNVGNIRDGGSTNDATPTLAGRISAALEPGQELQILRNDSVVGSTTEIGGTSWRFTDRLPGDGDYDYTVRVVDAAGNVGRESATYDIRANLPRAAAGNGGGNGGNGGDDDDDDDDDDRGERQLAADTGPSSLTLAELLQPEARSFSAGATTDAERPAGDAPAMMAALSSPLDQLPAF